MRAVRVEVSRQLQPGDVVAGRYALDGLIGRGGMGQVWRGRHLELDAPVAIKLAAQPGERSPHFRERFRREARALAQHRSPDLVQILDVGEHQGMPFLVMELLRGESLKARLAREATMPVAELVDLISGVGRALGVIHGAGLVHRDVTPANIFILERPEGSGGTTAKLLDLGIAKPIVADSHTTTTGTVIGSPAYMSPEQARAEQIDARSDLWSLAAVVYRALSGRDVFEGRSVTDVLLSVCTADVTPCTIDGAPAPRLDAFFEKAFARNPERRWSSAASFVLELRSALALPEEREHAPSPPANRPALGYATLGGALLGAAILFLIEHALSSAVAAPQPANCPPARPATVSLANPEPPPGTSASPMESASPAPSTHRLPRSVAPSRAPAPTTTNSSPPRPAESTDPVFGLPVPDRAL